MTVQTLEKKVKTHPVPPAEVRWLYLHLPPVPIDNDRDHAVYRQVVDFLYDNDKTRGAFSPYLQAVAHFLDEYEQKRFGRAVTPEDVLRFLMEEHHLTQSDLAKDLGGQPIVSAVLRGKRRLTRDHIETLSRRFSITPAAFYPLK